MMQTQIPSGLQALMQASQVLSSQASPTAPGPQGPQPTIAERVNQQIKQTAAPPESGIAGLSPNMRDIGQQAGVAGQIMAQRAAQQEQTARNPEAIAQMAAQMMQSKGVAGLPAKMGFKEGGIIGYAGPEGSDVKKPADSLVEAQQRLIAATKSGDVQAAQFYAKQVADLRRQMTTEPAGSPGEQVAEPIAPQSTRGMPDGTPTLGETARARLKDIANILPSGLPAGAGIEQFRTAFADKKEDRPATPAVAGRQVDRTQIEGYGVPASAAGIQTVLPTPVPKPAPKPVAKPAADQAGPAASLNKIPETKVDTSGITEPTVASMEAGISTLVPKRAEALNAELAKDEEARKKLKASFEDLNAKEIAALEESKRTRKQLAESKAERDQFNRVRAFFEDLGNRGATSYRTVQEGIFAREEAERLADLNHDKAVILLQKAQQAEKLGDLDRAMELKKQANDRLSKEDQHRMEAGKITTQLATSVYGQKMDTARTEATIRSANVRTEAELAQRDRALQANLEIERQKVAGLSADRRNSERGQMLTAALGRLNDATRNYSKVADDNKSAIAMSEAKDPVAQKMYTDAKGRVDLAEKTYQEAKKVFDSIAAEVLKGYATTPSSTGNAKADPLGIR
jgi:tetratricopeptide (TPR) repeat protein